MFTGHVMHEVNMTSYMTNTMRGMRHSEYLNGRDPCTRHSSRYYSDVAFPCVHSTYEGEPEAPGLYMNKSRNHSRRPFDFVREFIDALFSCFLKCLTVSKQSFAGELESSSLFFDP